MLQPILEMPYKLLSAREKRMARKSAPAAPNHYGALIQTYAINDAINQLFSRASIRTRGGRSRPGEKGNGRTIAAMFAHLHNCRLTWLKNSAPHLECPAPLDPYRCTIKQASAAHSRSGMQCLRMLEDALSADPKRRVTKFSRGSWAPEWPASAAMFAYMFSHEGHHRGQILMLAHQLGYRLPQEGIWQWDKLWKQAGFASRPG